ncbi:hypothetical protein [Treponema pedis]|nr:hypothetical protein [Treponema pedis]
MFKGYKKAVCLIFLFLVCAAIFCEEEEKSEKTFPDAEFNTEISLEINYPWNVFLSASEYIKLNSRISDKKYTELSIKGILALTSLEASFGMKFVYLNFADFFTEFSAGSGWCFEKAFLYGLAGSGNLRGRKKIVPYNFSKAVFSLNSGFDFHFNLAEVLTGDWFNLVFRTVQGIKYRALIPAEETDFWFWQNGFTESRNGALYSASYSVEYSMPLYINKLALKLITEKKLYAPISGTVNEAEKLWDFELSFSLFFKPADFVTIKLEPSWASTVLYESDSEKVYFIYKRLNKNKMQALNFKNISAAVSFSF